MHSSIRHAATALLLAGGLLFSPVSAQTQSAAHVSGGDYANSYDDKRADVFAKRAADWRSGAVVYQVIVDRFAPAANLEAKKDLYPAPKRIRNWNENPEPGSYVPEAGFWSHEIDFWGGDLQSLSTKLDYIKDLGVDVLYLNPIQQAYTNHKYDAQNYFEVSKEYGTRADVKKLADDVHNRDMKLMLDGVFNHMGKTSPWFQEALKDPKSEWREWYYIGPEYKEGYRCWVNVPNLPEVNLESERVRGRLFNDKDSVIQGYLREGVDGWRLDVAFDIGFDYLQELTNAAHSAKPGSLVVGEIWNYPQEWFPSIDGIMNMTMRQMILDMLRGNVGGGQMGAQIDQLVTDCGIDNLLKSWVILDNHDTPRLKTVLTEQWQQRMAQTLQFTLPGSPCIYYGVEIGMDGGEDPRQRGPMQWDKVNDSNEQLQWTRKLIAIHQDNPALRIGDFRRLESSKLLAFMRTTDSVRDAILVVANPSDAEVKDFMTIRDSKIMSYAVLKDQLGDTEARVMGGTLSITVPPRTIYVMKSVVDDATKEYSPYKRVK